jgi:hypothetical protein
LRRQRLTHQLIIHESPTIGSAAGSKKVQLNQRLIHHG